MNENGKRIDNSDEKRFKDVDKLKVKWTVKEISSVSILILHMCIMNR